MTRILVTGGTGFLGQFIVRKLHLQGYDVLAMGRNVQIGKSLAGEGFKFIRVDLADARSVGAAIEGRDVVIHAGGLSSPWGKWSAFHRANVLGTKNVVDACLRHRVKRLVHVSSSSVYFDFKHREGIKESDGLAQSPANHYVRSKIAAEEIVAAASRKGLSTVILRPRGLFGPGDTSILPRLLRANERLGVPIFERGKIITDITYVGNAADACICAAFAENLTQSTFNITNNEPLPIAEILQMLCAAIGKPLRTFDLNYQTGLVLSRGMEMAASLSPIAFEPVFTPYTLSLFAFNQTLDISAAQRELAYQPQVSIKEGLRLFAESYVS